MECINCGKPGHTFRDCREPVVSYGICAVKIVDSVPYYLLIRRRDSMSYVEFLRGKYRFEQAEYIELLIRGMTGEERSRLLTTPFDRLWENLWNGQNNRQFRNEYDSAKRTFELMKTTGDVHGKQLAAYLETLPVEWEEAEWGFPKGRRTLHETELTCALREFSEETGFSPRVLHSIEEEPRQVEEYVGTNGIAYRQVYYVGGCAAATVAMHQPQNRVMAREVGAIGWFPYEVAREKIRSTNPEKRAVLERLHARMEAGLKDRILSAVEWSHS